MTEQNNVRLHSPFSQILVLRKKWLISVVTCASAKAPASPSDWYSTKLSLSLACEIVYTKPTTSQILSAADT